MIAKNSILVCHTLESLFCSGHLVSRFESRKPHIISTWTLTVRKEGLKGFFLAGSKKIFAKRLLRLCFALSAAQSCRIVFKAWATFEASTPGLLACSQPVSAAISATATNGSCSLRKKNSRIGNNFQYSDHSRLGNISRLWKKSSEKTLFFLNCSTVQQVSRLEETKSTKG